MKLTEKEWKKKLTPKQYHILREKGTELPFTGKYNNSKKKGRKKMKKKRREKIGQI